MEGSLRNIGLWYTSL